MKQHQQVIRATYTIFDLIEYKHYNRHCEFYTMEEYAALKLNTCLHYKIYDMSYELLIQNKIFDPLYLTIVDSSTYSPFTTLLTDYCNGADVSTCFLHDLKDILQVRRPDFFFVVPTKEEKNHLNWIIQNWPASYDELIEFIMLLFGHKTTYELFLGEEFHY